MRPATRTDPPRLAVLGAGPVGLEAALAATALGWPVTVYERGQPGEHVLRWGHVRMFTPFGANVTPAGRDALRRAGHTLPADADLLSGAAFHAAYLAPLAASEPLAKCIRAGVEVVQVGRAGWFKRDPVDDPRRAAAPFRLLLREKKREFIEEADAILDCTGTFGRPCRLGDGGLPAVGEAAARPKIEAGVPDALGAERGHYAGRCVLLVGAGPSAAATAGVLADLAVEEPATWVVWLTRSPRKQPVARVANDPVKERDRLAMRANHLATRGEGNLEFHAAFTVASLESAGDGWRVTARFGTRELVREVERIVANVGYAPDAALCGELHVEADTGRPAAVRQPEPGYFLCGMRRQGRDGNFLLRQGYDHVREALAVLAGRRA